MTVDEHVEVGMKILMRALFVALLLWVLYLVRDVVLLVLLAVITSAAVTPAVFRLKQAGFSRTTAVILIYTLLFSGLIALVALFVPIFLDELREFISHWPQYSERLGVTLTALQNYLQPLGVSFDKETFLLHIEQSVSQSFSGIFSTTVSFFSGLISVLGFFFLALYLSLEEKGIEKFFLLITPERYHAYALSIAERMQGKVSQWLFGQLLLMLIVFGIYLVGLSLLDVPYALALAFFGGLMEIIPYIGPILAAVPGVILAFLVSPVLGISTLIFYVVAHQLEGHIIAPQVLKRSIGLSPVVLIIAALVGAKLAGPLGILLAIPTVMMLSVFVEDLVHKKGIKR